MKFYDYALFILLSTSNEFNEDIQRSKSDYFSAGVDSVFFGKLLFLIPATIVQQLEAKISSLPSFIIVILE